MNPSSIQIMSHVGYWCFFKIMAITLDKAIIDGKIFQVNSPEDKIKAVAPAGG
jgi:hypothetical protein